MNPISKITINFEDKWHLQIYVESDYDIEEAYDQYFETLDECFTAINNYKFKTL